MYYELKNGLCYVLCKTLLGPHYSIGVSFSYRGTTRHVQPEEMTVTAEAEFTF